MISRLLKSTVVFIAIGSIILSTSVVTAQSADQSVMTEDHIVRIQQNCRAAQRTIQQVFVSDGLLRVDRGQVYESISSKLMAPLNSRLTLAKLDASQLVKTTAQYNKSFSSFQGDYKAYYDQMNVSLALDCEKQPVAFYDSVTLSRQLRAKVHSDVLALRESITTYEKSFDTFRQQLPNRTIEKQ